MILDNLLSQIDKGREGKNWGLPMGLPKLEQYVDGVSQGTYTLLFSGSGVGKTSLALYSYIYRPIMDNLNNSDQFHIFYISLEMKAEVLLAKLLSTYIFETYGKEISYKEMLSKTRNTILSDEDYDLIKRSIPWMKKIESMLTIWDKSLNSSSFFKLMKDLADKNGTFYEEQNRKYYTPNNPDKVILVVIDHLALVQNQVGNSLKNEMDAISKVAVQFRNRCNFSFLMIMQANRESANVERRKLELVEPQRQDVKDSSCMEADSDIMIAVFNPFREKLTSYRGYNIKALKANFRSIILLKNRYGDGDISIGCNFFGKCNLWKELPRADQIQDYEKFTDINTYKQIKDKEEIEDVEEFKTDMPSMKSIEIIL